MKTITLTGWPPRLMRTDVAEEYVGGKANLDRLKEFGLKPTREAKSNTIYLKDEVDKAINEAHAAGWDAGSGAKNKVPPNTTK